MIINWGLPVNRYNKVQIKKIRGWLLTCPICYESHSYILFHTQSHIIYLFLMEKTWKGHPCRVAVIPIFYSFLKELQKGWYVTEWHPCQHGLWLSIGNVTHMLHSCPLVAFAIGMGDILKTHVAFLYVDLSMGMLEINIYILNR